MGEKYKNNTDNVSILLKYKNGSNAIINYFSNGSKSYPKERIEVFSQGSNLVIDNWKTLYGFGCKNFKKKSIKQDKGHHNQFKLLIEQQNNGGLAIIPFDEIINTTKTTFSAIKSLTENRWVDVIDD